MQFSEGGHERDVDCGSIWRRMADAAHRLVALTREVPPSFARAELTHLERVSIDVAGATLQHREYERALEAAGCTVVRLPAEPDLPDSVFVEDTALVFEEIAVVMRPGARSRRPETRSMAAALSAYRPIRTLAAPATMDGGDVLRVGRRVYVGVSTRTNLSGLEQLRTLVSPYGYTVHPVEVGHCLHLKSAATEIAGGRLLINPAWVDAAVFNGLRTLAVHPEEGSAANVVWIGGTVICPAAAPRTRERLEALGATTIAVDVSEIAKAEGGLTCCSVLIPP